MHPPSHPPTLPPAHLPAERQEEEWDRGKSSAAAVLMRTMDGEDEAAAAAALQSIDASSTSVSGAQRSAVQEVCRVRFVSTGVVNVWCIF